MRKWTRANYQPNLPLGENGERVTASPAHLELSRQAAQEGMVLLKNEAGLLPLRKGSRIALFGKAGFDYVKGGGGSGDVTADGICNLYDGLLAKHGHVALCEELSDYYRKYVADKYAIGALPGMIAEPEIPDTLLARAKAFTDTACITISRFSGEGWDRHVSTAAEEDGKADPGGSVETDDADLYANVFDLTGISARIFEKSDFCLTRAERKMVDTVIANFSNVFVVLNVGGMIDTSWFRHEDRIQSVLLAWQGGTKGGLAAADLLCGDANPSGKLPDTFADSLEAYPSTDTFHESENYVDYTEDIYVGYRYFETIPQAAGHVCYPFGFGLSYTTFEIEELNTCLKDGAISMQIRVTNTGGMAGKEVVQVYAQSPSRKLDRPARMLAAFAKTRLLLSGETQLLTISFPISALAAYDDLGKIQKSAYILEAGTYHFHIGNSVRNTVRSSFVFAVSEDTCVSQLQAKVVPTSLKQRLLADGTLETLPQGTPRDPNACGLKRDPYYLQDLAPQVRAHDRYISWRRYEPDTVLFSQVAEGTADMDTFLAQLSDEDLACLLGGQPNTGVANTFGFGNLPEYGVPNIMTADGPAGLRVQPECEIYTTAWPCATLLAATWNPDLLEAVGEAAAKELKENNISVWLAPAINIHRSPLCGRNFEYYSEDPLLTGKLAAALVRGVQSQHIGTTVKHFACNNKETNRKNSDSRVSERALREIYLKGFEIVVKEAAPWAIMSSYNLINGCRASECRELLTDILRNEWGFTGMVTTDWWTFGEQYLEIKAGNDMKMGTGFPERVLEALQKGLISRSELETSVKRVLELILKVD